MIEGQRIIAIVPARGGSKGLPGKNIRPLCGKPLIAWTIERALQSKYLDVVMVSTDSAEIAGIARHHGADIPVLRPADLATDTASSYDVIDHVLEHYRDSEHLDFGYTVLLEPTSPLREAGDIDRMIEKLHQGREHHDAIVSIGEVSEHPAIVKRLSGDCIEPFFSGLAQTTRRQDNVPAFFPYGVAYIAKTDVLQRQRTFYLPNAMGYPIQRYQEHEIDDIYDFLCVEAIMKFQWSLS